ncbi:dynamin family protein [Microcoleus sp. FACHB-68]|uniref:dynamin family protein n=1 Tax=Microcoleus sp. FACHB-68 TaxID=2692826 RepID=UPI001681F8F7|nr:dynamin family protein [Microcoleus sp. FACHB-68]MBD1936253.1 dynamin family protein [Microcoleus sp. FACHB-68]
MDASLYQQNRKKLLEQLTNLKSIYEDIKYRDSAFFNELPQETSQRFALLDRDISRLRNPNLTIAFVGGFSAGKSSLINAFLGRYLLPESTEVTTAVPTYVKSSSDEEYAKVFYLNINEIEALDGLYRKEIAETFRVPQLENAPVHELLERVQPMAQEGRGSRLLANFQLFLEKRKTYEFGDERYIENCSIEKMQHLVRDESQAIFLERVEVFIKSTDIPQDVILVDLPGVSVPNPRHRQVTFRFVNQDAHAIIFILMATRLFDRDEMEIMEKIRAGESQLNRKTFWVLNRWDSLTSQQQKSSLANFQEKMREFAIPDDYNFFTTNALHGLLAQLSSKEEMPCDPKLIQHLSDYKELLDTRYEGKHKVALQESQIAFLRDSVLEFLQDDLRRVTLETTVGNVEQNFCQPILNYLRSQKDADESMIQGELQQSEKEEARRLTTELMSQRKREFEDSFRSIRDRVANARSTMFTDQAQAKELEDSLKKEIKNGDLTDAYKVYTRIISDNYLRKYPYYFEIEINVVDNLNQLLKKRFLEIAREQVTNVVEDLVKEINNRLEELYSDVKYDLTVSSGFRELMQDIANRFQSKVDGVVMERAARLDELLVYRGSKISPLFGGGNEILTGLEKAARMQSQHINNPAEAIRPEDMTARTNQIRATLEKHYIDKTNEFRKEVAEAVWSIVIAQMQELEKEVKEAMNTRYRSILEQVKSKQASDEFAHRRSSITSRTSRFRTAIEKIHEVSIQMRSGLQSTSN